MNNKQNIYQQKKEELRQIVLLKEYEKAQDAAEYADNIGWQVTGIIIGAMAIMLSFLIGNINSFELKIMNFLLSVLGIFLALLCILTFLYCQVIKDNAYNRCREIEKDVGMKLHTLIKKGYPIIPLKLFLYGILGYFIIIWSAILYII